MNPKFVANTTNFAVARKSSRIVIGSSSFHHRLANTCRRSCTDGVSAVANAAWLSLRKIGSDAPRGRKTANQVGASKSARPCSELARFGKAAYTLVREIPSPCHFSKEGLMGSERTSRRELLKGGTALAGGVTLAERASSPAQAHSHPISPVT